MKKLGPMLSFSHTMSNKDSQLQKCRIIGTISRNVYNTTFETQLNNKHIVIKHLPLSSTCPYLFYFPAVQEIGFCLVYISTIFLKGTVNEQNRYTVILVLSRKSSGYCLKKKQKKTFLTIQLQFQYHTCLLCIPPV